MVASLAHGAGFGLFGLVARNGLVRGLHSVAPFGARPAAPFTLRGFLQAQDHGAAYPATLPPRHAMRHATLPPRQALPICHACTQPRHQAKEKDKQ